MKKILTALLASAMLFAAVGCKNNQTPSGESTITGTSSEVLSQVIGNADYAEAPMVADEALTAENCESTLGLPVDTFNSSVVDGTLSYAMISAVAHMTAMLKCNDAQAAVAVRDAIASGFNVTRWVCVIPEKVFAVNAGEYVFFVASFTDYADALSESFSTLAGDGLGETVAVCVD